MAKKIKITETALRDAHQSLIATRMTTEEMLPILDKLDKIGYYSLECWGGATYDSCLRFLNEDPWERLRTIKDHCPNTKLQMLFRGQNMLGYRHYADDCVEYLVQRSIANGIDIIRIFDALNDIKNLKTAIKAAKKEGGHAQVAISYTTGPVFTDEYYVEYAKRIADAGADSICIKDMAALLTPSKTESLVKAIKEALPEMPLQLHTHYTSGLASMCLLKGVEAGADGIDTAISPLALGTSHAPTESMVAALQGTEFDTGLDIKELAEIRAYFMTLREKYIESGLLDPKMLATDAKALIYQVPGGMLSNLLSQLKQAGREDDLDKVLEEYHRGHHPSRKGQKQTDSLTGILPEQAGNQTAQACSAHTRQSRYPDDIPYHFLYILPKLGQPNFSFSSYHIWGILSISVCGSFRRIRKDILLPFSYSTVTAVPAAFKPTVWYHSVSCSICEIWGFGFSCTLIEPHFY